ncbi:MAG: thiamine diphosphokinase [Anaerolineaceae bacterium]|nr:thiamine diphosphokinase [Anaerolineaceae bacterium]MCY3908279.1 thiamine diphosphokinase [Anaerolineaceae bacterium]
MNAGADALVFANGVLTAEPLLSETRAALPRATIIAADGGARLARNCGLRVDVVIGDMDSIDAGELERLRAGGAQVLCHPADKDETDLELALKWAAARAYRRLRVFGAFGNRLDQTLANVQLLALEELRDCDLQLLDGRQRVRLLRPGAHEIGGAVGDTISLLPLQGAARGIASEGLRWELKDETLAPGPARGVSNQLTAAPARLRLREGLLVLVHTRGRA